MCLQRYIWFFLWLVFLSQVQGSIRSNCLLMYCADVLGKTYASSPLKEKLEHCRSTLYQSSIFVWLWRMVSAFRATFDLWNMHSYFVIIAALHLLMENYSTWELFGLVSLLLSGNCLSFNFPLVEMQTIWLWNFKSSFSVLWRFFPILSTLF